MSLPLPDPAAIDAQICAAIRKVKPSLEKVPIEAETAMANLGLESLQIIEITWEIEEAFDVKIESRYLTFRTVAEARKLVLDLLARTRETEPTV